MKRSFIYLILALPSIVILAKTWLWIIGLGAPFSNDQGFTAAIFVFLNFMVIALISINTGPG